MQAEDVAIGALCRIGDAGKHLFKIVDASRHGGICTLLSPSVVVEIGVRRIHHPVKHHLVAMLVVELVTIHMQWSHDSKLREGLEWHHRHGHRK